MVGGNARAASLGRVKRCEPADLTEVVRSRRTRIAAAGLQNRCWPRECRDSPVV